MMAHRVCSDAPLGQRDDTSVTLCDWCHWEGSEFKLQLSMKMFTFVQVIYPARAAFKA